MLTHEREHVRRRDPLVRWLALLNRCVFWFHPLAWWLERPRAAQPSPYCDPCRVRSFSLSRFILLATLALYLIPGSLLIFILLVDTMKRPRGLQETSAIVYTLYEVLFTFAATRYSGRPYMFTCPAVRTQVPRLLLRHLGFLIALFALQTAALTGLNPFETVLALMCIGLAFAQVSTNRSLLEGAHRELSPFDSPESCAIRK